MTECLFSGNSGCMKGAKSVKECVNPVLMVLALKNVAASLDLEGENTSLVPKSRTAAIRQ